MPSHAQGKEQCLQTELNSTKGSREGKALSSGQHSPARADHIWKALELAGRVISAEQELPLPRPPPLKSEWALLDTAVLLATLSEFIGGDGFPLVW